MNPTTRNIVIGIVAVLILVLLGYLAWHNKQAPQISSTATSTPSASTSTGTTIDVTQGATSTGGYTITRITPAKGPTAPNYQAPLVFSDPNLTADIRAEIQRQFVDAQASIKAKPTDSGAWITLGTLRMEAGDYQGAAADWNYVTKLYPNDPTAYADLGNLYATYLHQTSQAIANYKQAIKLDPTKEATFYQNLAQVYLGQGDTADAKATLQQGIDAKVVGYQNLQTQLNAIQ